MRSIEGDVMVSLPRSCRHTSVLATLLLLVACASTKPVPETERDTSGAYDGVWSGFVAAPTATRVTLPGNWYMRCDWQPFEFSLQVTDGMVQVADLVDLTPISTDGRFRLDVIISAAGMDQGVMAGNGKFVDRFAGRLQVDTGSGSYLRYISSIGVHGCSTRIHFERQGKPVDRNRLPIV